MGVKMKSPIFLALDIKDVDEAVIRIDNIKRYLYGIKIGMEFFYANGKTGYLKIKELGLPIFLDLKIHDIPNTTHNAILSLADIAPEFVSIHGCSDSEVLKRAKEASLKTGIGLLAVTALTSGSDSINYEMVENCLAHNIDGLICSGKENKELRKIFGQKFFIVNPGIRPENSLINDQNPRRVITPKEAMENGANFLVIGRPILNAADPLKAAQEILETIQ
jgi:orotidine-5'-phosphate decarboxylase